ncbi:MAG: PD-(D/E)XK motif protein [bacterium]
MSNPIDRIRKLLEDHTNESYQRYSAEHPLDIYLGTDQYGRKSLALIIDARRERITSTKTIDAQFFKRDDGQLMLVFSLIDDQLKDIFYKFCEDIIESTRLSNQVEGFAPVVDRWNTWINFFSKSVLPLSENEVLGLVGEIYFLQNVMIEKYGKELALDSYIGTDRAHKDFEVKNTWYEIKTIHNGIRAVKISSIEQLDAPNPGNLEIITFDQSTATYEGNITLNKLISGFRSTLERKWQLLFDEKMRRASYIEDERYDEYNFVFVRIDEYSVADDFPKLTKELLPMGVTKASYEIDISVIERFRT